MNWESALKRISWWSLLSTTGISLLSLAGWASGLLIIASIKNYYIPIAPSTALCFLILGAPLSVSVTRPDNGVARTAAAVSALFTLLVCMTLLVAFLNGTVIEYEHLGFASPLLPIGNVLAGHMSPLTAINFIAASLGILSLTRASGGRRYYRNIAAFLAVAVLSVGAVVLLGYLYGTPVLYGGHFIPVALPTAVAFLLLGLGLITAAGPSVPPIRVFMGQSVQSRLVRAFLPFIIVFVLVDGWLYNTAFPRAGNPALVAAFIAIVSAIIVGFIVSRIATSIGSDIDRADAAREKAEKRVKLDEDRLNALLHLSQIRAGPESDITDYALEEAVRLTMSKGGYLHFFDEDEQTIRLQSWSQEVLKTCKAEKDSHYPLGAAGVWADSVRLRKPVIHNDYQRLDNKKGYPAGHFHLVRHLGLPVFDGDRIVCVTGVGNKEEPYNEVDVRQLSLLMNSMWGILKQQRMAAKLELLAITDDLTGLANRRHFNAVLEEEVRRARRGNYSLTLMMIDVDFFKRYNDLYGHLAGDQCLQAIAAVLSDACRRAGQLPARYGGEEFAIIMPGSSPEEASLVAEKLRLAVMEKGLPHKASHTLQRVTISIGVVTATVSSFTTSEWFIKAADDALYLSKAQGRNLVNTVVG